ncbi:MAG: Flp family type IVb pilin [Ardenticatenales bacterium]|nr:Flp family type IVb pilin [Ardenticatenales bacterium]
MYLPREEGQGLAEYGLILVLVAVAVIAILSLLGPQIGRSFPGSRRRFPPERLLSR